MFTPAHLWVTFCENFSELVWNKICIYESCKTTGRRRPKKISGYFLCKCPWSIPESIQGIVFFGGVFIDHCFQHCTIVKANLIHQFRYPLHDLQCYSVHRQFAILKVHLSWTKIAPSHVPCSTRKYEASNIWLFRYYLHTCLSTFKYISSKFLKRSEEIKHQYLFNLKFKLSSTFMFAPFPHLEVNHPAKADQAFHNPTMNGLFRYGHSLNRAKAGSLYHLYPFLIPTSHSFVGTTTIVQEIYGQKFVRGRYFEVPLWGFLCVPFLFLCTHFTFCGDPSPTIENISFLILEIFILWTTFDRSKIILSSIRDRSC